MIDDEMILCMRNYDADSNVVVVVVVDVVGDKDTVQYNLLVLMIDDVRLVFDSCCFRFLLKHHGFLYTNQNHKQRP